MARIIGSVGREGRNRITDVKQVQRLLNEYPIPRIRVPLEVDGKIGRKTIRRIELFQKSVVGMARPDGRIDPGGKTFKILSTTRSGTKPVTSLEFSNNGINLLKQIEQLRTRPYDDQTGEDVTRWVKGATIGYGHLIRQREWSKYKNGISKSQALKLLNQDLAPFIHKIKDSVKVKIKQHEFDALVFLAFNIGLTAFANSSVLRLVNNPRAQTPYPSLEKAWKAWNKSQGRLNRGLINRRAAEWQIYTNNIYKRW